MWVEREIRAADEAARYRDEMPVDEYRALMARVLACPVECGCRGIQTESEG